MMYSTLDGLLNDQLLEIYAAEAHLVRAMPQFLEGASSSEFQSFLRIHLEETEKHLNGLDAVLSARGLSSAGAKCRVVDALIKHGSEIAERRGNEIILDLGLIFVMRQIENYERCAYEIARTMAETLNLVELVEILDQNLKDEEEMERSWTVLSEDMIDTLHVEIGASLGERSRKSGPGVVAS